nr:MAG TPA: Lacto-N-biose phosphorylase [Caudoviricetes sp.]
MVWDPIISSDWHHELWVRLRVTMKDGNKYTGWCYIPGDNDWAYERGEKKPFKCIRSVVNYHIAHNESIQLYERYFEEVPIAELNACQIRTFTITDRVFGVPNEVWEAKNKVRYEQYQAMRGDKNGD